MSEAQAVAGPVNESGARDPDLDHSVIRRLSSRSACATVGSTRRDTILPSQSRRTMTPLARTNQDSRTEAERSPCPAELVKLVTIIEGDSGFSARASVPPGIIGSACVIWQLPETVHPEPLAMQVTPSPPRLQLQLDTHSQNQQFDEGCALSTSGRTAPSARTVAASAMSRGCI